VARMARMTTASPLACCQGGQDGQDDHCQLAEGLAVTVLAILATLAAVPKVVAVLSWPS
jgi:hypothetical protein